MAVEIESGSVPADFPWSQQLGAVTGYVPKLLLVRTEAGKYEAPVVSEAEREQRWHNCEDLAAQFAEAAAASKAGKRSDWREEDILAQYLPRLQQKRWASKDECVWILRRVGLILGWPLPESLLPVEDGTQ